LAIRARQKACSGFSSCRRFRKRTVCWPEDTPSTDDDPVDDATPAAIDAPTPVAVPAPVAVPVPDPESLIPVAEPSPALDATAEKSGFACALTVDVPEAFATAAKIEAPTACAVPIPSDEATDAAVAVIAISRFSVRRCLNVRRGDSYRRLIGGGDRTD
jgi:hypothetical protein